MRLQVLYLFICSLCVLCNDKSNYSSYNIRIFLYLYNYIYNLIRKIINRILSRILSQIIDRVKWASFDHKKQIIISYEES